MRVTLTITTVIATLALTGCSSADKTASASKPAADATALANNLSAKLDGNVSGIVTITDANDMNHAIGKPHQYLTAAVLHDKRADDMTQKFAANDPTGFDDGAKIEVFANAADATARASYLDKLGQGSAMFSDGADVVSGNELLRVSRHLTNEVIDTYKAAWAQVG